jgi:hypothetical protein
MLHERPTDDVRDRVARHVVVCGAETACEDDKVHAVECTPNVFRNLATVVTDDGFRPQFDTQGRQTFREQE